MLDISFPLIRAKLILFVLVVFSCVGIITLSYWFLEEQREDNRVFGKQIQAQNNSLVGIMNDVSLVKAFSEDFKYLSKSGFLDKENRLSWVEQLEITAERLQLKNLKYQMDPQLKVVNARFVVPASVDLFQSTLNFESSLLHEGDLVALVNDLDALSSGLLVLEHCQFVRISKSLNDSGSHNFNANCDISWYTAVFKSAFLQQVGGQP